MKYLNYYKSLIHKQINAIVQESLLEKYLKIGFFDFILLLLLP